MIIKSLTLIAAVAMTTTTAIAHEAVDKFKTCAIAVGWCEIDRSTE
jgi:hypothetical protein